MRRTLRINYLEILSYLFNTMAQLSGQCHSCLRLRVRSDILTLTSFSLIGYFIY